MGDRPLTEPQAGGSAPASTLPAPIESLGFLHVGRPESGVRRYGRLIAEEAAQRPGLRLVEVDAGRLDERRGHLPATGRALDEAEVTIVQWNRRGWGGGGRSLSRLVRFRRACRGPLVVTLHDVFDRRGLRERWLSPDAWSLRWLARNADRIVVHSQVEVERLAGIVAAEKLRVVPHFVEQRALPMAPAQARARLGLSDRRIVTLLGFVYGRKGHRFAVEAVPDLPPDVVLVYAGGPVAGRDFVYRLSLDKAEKLGLGDRFRITGYLSDEELETWMAATNLAILPFNDLSASGSLSSWIAVGKPMLVSDLPGFREYDARVPGALRFFGPPDAGPLAKAVNALLESGLPEVDERVLALRDELSMARTLDRYLAVAAEAKGAHGRG